MRPADLALAVFIQALWGFNFVAAKFALDQIPPILLTALRFGLVAILLVPFVRLPRAHLPQIALMSLTLGTAHYCLMFSAVADLDAGTASLLAQSQVVFAAILAALAFGDRLGWRRAAGMAVAIAGIALIVGEPRLSADLTPVWLILGAAFMWSVANVQVKAMPGARPLAVNAYMSVLCTPQLVAVSLAFERDQLAALAAVDWRGLLALVYLAVVTTILTHSWWYRLVGRYSVNQTMPFTLLSPIFAVLAGVLFRDEAFGWRDAVGGALTIMGVGIIVLRRPRPA